MKRVFGSSQDQLLNHLRGALRADKPEDGKYVLRKEFKSFDFLRLADMSLPTGKSLKVTGQDIDRFLEFRKGPSAFSVLQLLYPNLRYREVCFHQDHIHPAAGFKKETFVSIGLDSENQEQWLERCDQIPNLQLMEGTQNQSKNATALKDWLARMTEHERQNFLVQNFIPPQKELAFAEFAEFFASRRELLRNRLSSTLCVKESTAKPDADQEEIERVPDDAIEDFVFKGQASEEST